MAKCKLPDTGSATLTLLHQRRCHHTNKTSFRTKDASASRDPESRKMNSFQETLDPRAHETSRGMMHSEKASQGREISRLVGKAAKPTL